MSRRANGIYPNMDATADVHATLSGKTKEKTSTSTRISLLKAAKSLCSDFASGTSTDTLLTHFFWPSISGSETWSSSDTKASGFHQQDASTISAIPCAYEHGPSNLLQAPFLGRLFMGLDGVRKYFDLVQEYLTISQMEFRDDDYDIVDADHENDNCDDDDNDIEKCHELLRKNERKERVVWVRGRARFTYRQTSKSWDECFVYRLGLLKEGKTNGLSSSDGKQAKEESEDAWKISRYEVWADSASLSVFLFTYSPRNLTLLSSSSLPFFQFYSSRGKLF